MAQDAQGTTFNFGNGGLISATAHDGRDVTEEFRGSALVGVGTDMRGCTFNFSFSPPVDTEVEGNLVVVNSTGGPLAAGDHVRQRFPDWNSLPREVAPRPVFERLAPGAGIDEGAMVVVKGGRDGELVTLSTRALGG